MLESGFAIERLISIESVRVQFCRGMSRRTNRRTPQVIHIYDYWCPWPSDTMKSPGFFKPRGTHKGTKQPLFFFNLFLINFVTNIRWKVHNENIHGEASFYYYYFMCFLFFSFLYFCLFLKKKQIHSLRFFCRFLFLFFFVSSFLLI